MEKPDRISWKPLGKSALEKLMENRAFENVVVRRNFFYSPSSKRVCVPIHRVEPIGSDQRDCVGEYGSPQRRVNVARSRIPIHRAVRLAKDIRIKLDFVRVLIQVAQRLLNSRALANALKGVVTLEPEEFTEIIQSAHTPFARLMDTHCLDGPEASWHIVGSKVG